MEKPLGNSSPNYLVLKSPALIFSQFKAVNPLFYVTGFFRSLLAVKGNLTQAHAVLMKYASKESSSVDSDSLKDSLTTYYQSEVESLYKQVVVFGSGPRLCKRTAILCFNWYVNKTRLEGY